MTTCNIPFEAKKYACGPIAQPMPAAVKTPYVKLTFFKGQREITVGNKSSQSANIATILDVANIGTAFVKSFSYSVSNGGGVEAKIIDTSGSDFANFLSIMPDKECDPQKGTYNVVSVEFGWVFQDCNGVYQKYGTIEATYDDAFVDATGRFKAVKEGELIWLRLTEITVSESKGVWEYTLKLSSLMQSSAPFTKNSNPIGTDDQKVDLKTGIKKSLSEACKNYFSGNGQERYYEEAEVHFVRVSSNYGTSSGSGSNTQRVLETFKFKGSDGGTNGPRSVWAPEQQDPLSAARKWLNSFETDRNLGTYFITDTKTKKPTLLVMENPNDPCLITPECLGSSARPKKVYIVNGGQCSPVLEFKPSVQLTFMDPTTNIGANPSGMDATNGKPATSVPAGAKPTGNTNTCYTGEINKKGLETAMSIPGSNLNFRTPAQANRKEFKSIWANSTASKYYEALAPIEADLVIEGDPRYLDPVSLQSINIGIIYLNPFAVRNNGGDCDWIAYPNVNEFFSRTNYLVLGVSHQIDSSGYRTTLKLKSFPESKKKI